MKPPARSHPLERPHPPTRPDATGPGSSFDSALEARSSALTLTQLESKGIRKLRVLSESTIHALVEEAVERAIDRSRDAALRTPPTIAGQAQDDLRRLFEDIRRSLGQVDTPAPSPQAPAKSSGGGLAFAPETPEFHRYQGRMARSIARLIEEDQRTLRALSGPARERRRAELEERIEAWMDDLAALERGRCELGAEEARERLEREALIERILRARTELRWHSSHAAGAGS